MGVSVEWAVCVAILLRLLDEAVSHIAGSHTSPAFIFSSTNDCRSRTKAPSAGGQRKLPGSLAKLN